MAYDSVDIHINNLGALDLLTSRLTGAVRRLLEPWLNLVSAVCDACQYPGVFVRLCVCSLAVALCGGSISRTYGDDSNTVMGTIRQDGKVDGALQQRLDAVISEAIPHVNKMLDAMPF